jgi:hypothetical protein
MKKIFQILLFTSILAGFTECKFEEENIFDDSSANRIEKAKKEYAQLLCSSPNGWIMEYFPTDNQKGYTFLMKFFETGEVKILSKNELTGDKLVRDSCLFEFTSISGPVLTFDSYSENNTFHILSTPEDIPGTTGSEQGIGYGGDYEFVVIKTDENHILLKGLKRKVYIPLTRLPEEQDWNDYFHLLDEMNTALFNVNVPQLQLTVSDSLFTLTGGTSHIFKIVPDGGDPITDGVDVPFIVTDYGIRFVKPFETEGQSLQTFQLSEDKNSLICVDENVDAKIDGPETVLFFHGAIDNSYRWMLAVEDNSLSPVVKAAYDRLAESFRSRGITLGQISYIFNGKNNTNAVYIASTSGTGGYLYFNKEVITEGVKYTFKESFDNNGRTFYNNYDGTADLIELMSGSFRIEAVFSKLNPTKVKLTDVSDSNIWFTMFFK